MTTIIRDEELGGIMMIPLFCDWHVRRCNVKGCTDKPTTIVTQLAPDVLVCGFCETHYQEAAQEGGANFTLVFNDFDAFAQVEPHPTAPAQQGLDDSPAKARTLRGQSGATRKAA